MRCKLLNTGGVRSPKRALRGGSWNNNGRNCRSANRNANERDNRNDNIGVRVASSHARDLGMRPAPPLVLVLHTLRDWILGAAQLERESLSV